MNKTIKNLKGLRNFLSVSSIGIKESKDGKEIQKPKLGFSQKPWEEEKVSEMIFSFFKIELISLSKEIRPQVFYSLHNTLCYLVLIIYFKS